MQIIIKVTCSISMFSNDFFIIFLTYMKKIYHVNIIKIIKKNYKKKARERYQIISKEEKEKK